MSDGGNGEPPADGAAPPPRLRLRLVRADAPEPPSVPTGEPRGGDPTPPVRDACTRLFDLTGRVALVVGAGGLGTAIATALAEFGALVAVADLDLQAARRAAAACTRPGRPAALALQMDITSAPLARAGVAALEQAAGRIDILVNAAGVNIRKPAVDYAPTEWQRLLEVNLSGVFYVTQAVGQGMLERGHGRILTLASVSSTLGHPGHAPYAAAKGGVALLTKVLAGEWAARGVTVNAIGPTYVETDLTRAHLETPGVRDAIVARIPMGRLATPADLIGAAIFLCSDAAAFVTGQVLYVDGGRTTD